MTSVFPIRCGKKRVGPLHCPLGYLDDPSSPSLSVHLVAHKFPLPSPWGGSWKCSRLYTETFLRLCSVAFHHSMQGRVPGERWLSMTTIVNWISPKRNWEEAQVLTLLFHASFKALQALTYIHCSREPTGVLCSLTSDYSCSSYLYHLGNGSNLMQAFFFTCILLQFLPMP